MDREWRRKALEEKRARLQQLRIEATAASLSAGTNEKDVSKAASKTFANKHNRNGKSDDIDELVSSLLNKQDQRRNSLREDASKIVPIDAGSAKDTRLSEKPPKTVSRVRPSLQKATGVVTVSAPLHKVEVYNRGIQTDMEGTDMDSLQRSLIDFQEQQDTHSRNKLSNLENISPQNQVEVALATENTQEILSSAVGKRVSEEERSFLILDKDYISFLKQGTRVMERLIKENKMVPDLHIDYGKNREQEHNPTDVRIEKIKLLWTNSNEKWTQDRIVTGIQWSPHHKELFLTSYNKRRYAANYMDLLLSSGKSTQDPNGLVCIWSTFMANERPEYVFTCQSAIETAIFHPFAPHLIIGAAFSGQILIWSMKAMAVPVQRSQMVADGHSQPVFSIAVTGTLNAHRLCSVSTDGKLCVWDLSNISTPVESHNIKYENMEIAAVAVAFPEGEVNEPCIGTEDGRLYRLHVSGNKTGISCVLDNTHHAPITSIRFNKGGNTVNDLMLSSSMDWTIKLWSQKFRTTPLAVFDVSRDYVFDVQWSPTHPAMFATVNGCGILDVWNLNKDMEQPQASFDMTRGQANCALSSLQFSPNGKQILVGDSKGRLHMFDLSSDLYTASRDEGARLEKALEAFVEKQNSF